MSGILDSIKSVVSDVAYPNRESETGRDDHDAAVGATASHDAPDGLMGASTALSLSACDERKAVAQAGCGRAEC